MTHPSGFMDFLAAYLAAEPWQRDIAEAYLAGVTTGADQAPDCRAILEETAEAAISMLDQIDGDPDAEIETDFDLNPTSLQGVDRVPPRRITVRRAA